MGGKKMFVSMLDSVFNLPPVFDDSYYGGVIHEIREMEIANMGNYAHGNQPIQHMIYLYNYAGEPWKAQYWLREAMTRLYFATRMDIVVTRITARLPPGMCLQRWAFIRYVRVAMNM